MRERKEILKEYNEGIVERENNVYHQMTFLQKIQLEVLLDIRDLLTQLKGK